MDRGRCRGRGRSRCRGRGRSRCRGRGKGKSRGRGGYHLLQSFDLVVQPLKVIFKAVPAHFKLAS
jgi:hypothetical protein